MTKAHLWLALVATSALGLPMAQADQHQHSMHSKQAAGPLTAKPGGCMHEGKCEHGGMGMGGMGMHGDKGMSFAHVLVMHSEALKLTDEQLGKLHRIAMQHQKEHPALMAKMHESMMNLHQSMLDPAADEAAMKKAGTDHSAALQEMINDAVAERNKATDVLTADQKKALKTFKPDSMPPGKMAPKPDGKR